jgi:hypothetical protein
MPSNNARNDHLTRFVKGIPPVESVSVCIIDIEVEAAHRKRRPAHLVAAPALI